MVVWSALAAVATDVNQLIINNIMAM